MKSDLWDFEMGSRNELRKPALSGLLLPPAVPPDNHADDKNQTKRNQRNTHRQVFGRSIPVTRRRQQKPPDDQSAKLFE
jgi:hypothetical protein